MDWGDCIELAWAAWVDWEDCTELAWGALVGLVGCRESVVGSLVEQVLNHKLVVAEKPHNQRDLVNCHHHRIEIHAYGSKEPRSELATPCCNGR